MVPADIPERHPPGEYGFPAEAEPGGQVLEAGPLRAIADDERPDRQPALLQQRGGFQERSHALVREQA